MKINLLKKVYRSVILSGAIVGGVHLADGIKNGSNINYNHINLKSKKITSELNGYKIAFLSDIHNYPPRKLQKIVSTLNSMNIDLLLLGGDLAVGYRALPSLRVLAKAKATDGIYGVEGNHDRSDFLFPLMKIYGINPLLNQGILIKEGLYLGGVADFQNQKVDVSAALGGANRENFNILLCHNPDTTNIQDTSIADITLSGHIHGGEVTLFGIWAPALALKSSTLYNQQFMAGHVKSNFDANVYVSRGIGSHFPMRIFAPREVTIINLIKK